MVHVGGNLPVLGGYQTALQNQAGYQPVLSIRTGWVSSRVLPGLIPRVQGIIFERTGSQRTSFSQIKKINHTWVGYVNNPKYDS
jgi:hypothetical protein